MSLPKKNKSEAKIEELTGLVKRVQADFENYRKRTEKEEQRLMGLGKVLFVKQLLPFVDSLESARQQDKGVELLHKQLFSLLESQGIHKIASVGKQFDPHVHDCVCEDFSEKKKGEIIEEVAPGYACGDVIIRHPMVKLSKGNDNQQQNTKREDAGTGQTLQ
ncbi:MAG: nucleotide exchange factor GrpE [Candidatus Woesearchaeota archaeon]